MNAAVTKSGLETKAMPLILIEEFRRIPYR